MPDPLPTINAHLKFALGELQGLEFEMTHPQGPEQSPRRQALAESLRIVAHRVQAGDIIPDVGRIMRELLEREDL